MTAEVASVTEQQTVTEAARLMLEFNVGFIPVCAEDDTVLGTITDRDIALRVVAVGRSPQTEAREIMSQDLVTCRTDDDVSRAEDLMRANQVNRVLVLDEAGRLAGVLSLSDLAQYGDVRRAGETLADVTEREATPH